MTMKWRLKKRKLTKGYFVNKEITSKTERKVKYVTRTYIPIRIMYMCIEGINLENYFKQNK